MLIQNQIIIILLAAAVSVTNPAHGAKILIVFTLANHSHRVALQPLINALAGRNHEVTVFGPVRSEEPNPKVKEFCPKVLLEINEFLLNDKRTTSIVRRLENRNFDPWTENRAFLNLGFESIQQTIKSPDFLAWFENSHFDLIIYDWLSKEFVFPMAHKWNAKVIGFITGGSPAPNDLEFWGIPEEAEITGILSNTYSWLPDRFANIITLIDWYIAYTRDFFPKVDAVCREVFKFDFPPLEQLMIQKLDLLFLNEHFSAAYARAYPPFVVPVGGMHVKKSNGTLSKDMEDFIADAKEFVFISFGSIIKVSELPKELQQVLFNSVASFKDTRFFWKWEGELPQNLPKNVLAKKWFPQQDVLAHPKCKGFVSQGGLMSVQQALFHKVPILVVPAYSEQAYNARTAVHQGYGIYLEWADITEETFTNAIHQIMHNEKYSTNAKEASRRFKDRPLSAVDTAVWWTEYALRHDTAHLKSASLRQTWWERRSLDFWFLAFSLFFIFSAVSIAITVACLKFVLLLTRTVNSRKEKQN